MVIIIFCQFNITIKIASIFSIYKQFFKVNKTMGRNKIQINEIRDEKVKQVTFKKRRLGVLRKAM